MRYLVQAKVKPGQEKPLLAAIESGSLVKTVPDYFRRLRWEKGAGFAPQLGSCWFQECPFSQFFESLLELRLCVHNDRAIPGYGFLQRLARNEQKPDPLVAGLHRHVLSRIKQNQRAVTGFGRWRSLEPFHPFSWDRQGAGCIAKFSTASENISKSVPRGLNREGLPFPGRHADIHIDRVSGGRSFLPGVNLECRLRPAWPRA